MTSRVVNNTIWTFALSTEKYVLNHNMFWRHCLLPSTLILQILKYSQRLGRENISIDLQINNSSADSKMGQKMYVDDIFAGFKKCHIKNECNSIFHFKLCYLRVISHYYCAFSKNAITIKYLPNHSLHCHQHKIGRVTFLINSSLIFLWAEKNRQLCI